MTNIPTGSSLSSAPAVPGTAERRRAPRIAPLSADIYASGNGPARESSLQELKARSRKQRLVLDPEHPSYLTFQAIGSFPSA